MGANAVTTVPVYTAGEILTAADLNITNSGIPVFADSTARDAAFGGAGEKVLAEGQFAFLEDTNTTQFYDGAAWEPVGVAPGLVKVAGTTTFSAVSSFTLPAATFTSAYKNYLLLVECLASANANTMSLQVRSGATTATTNYYSALDRLLFTGSQANLVVNNGASFTLNASSIDKMSFILNLNAGFGQTGKGFISGFCMSGGGLGSSTIGGSHDISQNNDSIVFTISAGTITGNYEVYGYAL